MKHFAIVALMMWMFGCEHQAYPPAARADPPKLVSTRGGASAVASPPFSIEQCDQWLRDAEDRSITDRVTSRATMSSACYLSHLVDRSKR